MENDWIKLACVIIRKKKKNRGRIIGYIPDHLFNFQFSEQLLRKVEMYEMFDFFIKSKKKLGEISPKVLARSFYFAHRKN